MESILKTRMAVCVVQKRLSGRTVTVVYSLLFYCAKAST